MLSEHVKCILSKAVDTVKSYRELEMLIPQPSIQSTRERNTTLHLFQYLLCSEYNCAPYSSEYNKARLNKPSDKLKQLVYLMLLDGILNHNVVKLIGEHIENKLDYLPIAFIIRRYAMTDILIERITVGKYSDVPLPKHGLGYLDYKSKHKGRRTSNHPEWVIIDEVFRD